MRSSFRSRGGGRALLEVDEAVPPGAGFVRRQEWRGGRREIHHASAANSSFVWPREDGGRENADQDNGVDRAVSRAAKRRGTAQATGADSLAVGSGATALAGAAVSAAASRGSVK